jgi:mono/diheme cytochrome c family protein
MNVERYRQPLAILLSAVILAVLIFISVKLASDLMYGFADVEQGASLYERHCIACHGTKGYGDGVAATALTVKPDNIYEELNNPLQLKAELVDFVLNGDNDQASVMPKFNGLLTESEVNDILGYIKTVNE